MKVDYTCPSCGSELLSTLFNSGPVLTLAPETLLTCPDCLELAFTQEDRTLRKATRLERKEVLSDPRKREVIEKFAALAREFKSLRERAGRRSSPGSAK